MGHAHRRMLAPIRARQVCDSFGTSLSASKRRFNCSKDHRRHFGARARHEEIGNHSVASRDSQSPLSSLAWGASAPRVANRTLLRCKTVSSRHDRNLLATLHYLLFRPTLYVECIEKVSSPDYHGMRFNVSHVSDGKARDCQILYVPA